MLHMLAGVNLFALEKVILSDMPCTRRLKSPLRAWIVMGKDRLILP